MRAMAVVMVAVCAAVMLGCSPVPEAEPMSLATAVPTHEPVVVSQVTGPESGAFVLTCPVSWEMYRDEGHVVAFDTPEGSVVISAQLEPFGGDLGEGDIGRLAYWAYDSVDSFETVISACRRQRPEGELLSVALCKESLIGAEIVYHNVWCDAGEGGVLATQTISGKTLPESERVELLEIISGVVVDTERLAAALADDEQVR